MEFNSFTDHGDAAKMFIDGEWYARKGTGRVQIEPLPNVTVSTGFRNRITNCGKVHGFCYNHMS